MQRSVCVLRVSVGAYGHNTADETPAIHLGWRWWRVGCSWRAAVALSAQLRSLGALVAISLASGSNHGPQHSSNIMPTISINGNIAINGNNNSASAIAAEEADVLVLLADLSRRELVDGALSSVSARVVEFGELRDLVALPNYLIGTAARALEAHLAAHLGSPRDAASLSLRVHAFLPGNTALIIVAISSNSPVSRANLSDALNSATLSTPSGLIAHVDSVEAVSSLPKSLRESLSESWRALGVPHLGEAVVHVHLAYPALKGRSFLYPLNALTVADSSLKKPSGAPEAPVAPMVAASGSWEDAMLWTDPSSRSPPQPPTVDERTPSPRATFGDGFLDLPAQSPEGFPSSVAQEPASFNKRPRGLDDDPLLEEESELKRQKLPESTPAPSAYHLNSVLDEMGDLDDDWISAMEADAAPLHVDNDSAREQGEQKTLRPERGEGEGTPVPDELFSGDKAPLEDGEGDLQDEGDAMDVDVSPRGQSASPASPLSAPPLALTPFSAAAALGPVPSVPPFTYSALSVTSASLNALNFGAETPLTPLGYSPLSTDTWASLIPADYASLGTPSVPRLTGQRYDPTASHVSSHMLHAPHMNSMSNSSTSSSLIGAVNSSVSVQVGSSEAAVDLMDIDHSRSAVSTSDAAANALISAVSVLSLEESAALDLLLRVALRRDEHVDTKRQLKPSSQWSALNHEDRRVTLEALATAAQTPFEEIILLGEGPSALEIDDLESEDESLRSALASLRVTALSSSSSSVHVSSSAASPSPASSSSILELQEILTSPTLNNPNSVPSSVASLHGALHSDTLRVSSQSISSLPTWNPIPPSQVVVGFNAQWLSVAPNALRHWSKLRLEPYAPKKNIRYVVIADRSVQRDRSMSAALATLFRGLDASYRLAGLGRHERFEWAHLDDLDNSNTAATNGSGDASVHVDSDASWQALLAQCRAAREPLTSLLAPIAVDHCVVVYLVHGRSYHDHCEARRAVLLPLVSSQRARVAVQAIPSSWLDRSRHLEASSAALQALAADTYGKCRRLTMATQWSALRAKSAALDEPRLHEPIIALPSPGDASTWTLHCAYAWSADRRWLALSLCDSRAELLETRLLHVAGVSSAAAITQLWALLVKLIPLVRQRPWRLVIARCGDVHVDASEELDGRLGLEERWAWRDLLDEKLQDEIELFQPFFSSIALVDAYRIVRFANIPANSSTASSSNPYLIRLSDGSLNGSGDNSDRPLERALLFPHALALDVWQHRSLASPSSSGGANVDPDSADLTALLGAHYVRLSTVSSAFMTLAQANRSANSPLDPWPLPHSAALRLCKLAEESEY